MKVNKYLMRKAREDPGRFMFLAREVRGLVEKTGSSHSPSSVIYKTFKRNDPLGGDSFTDLVKVAFYSLTLPVRKIRQRVGNLTPEYINLWAEAELMDQL
jgi:hypothetical protein